MLRNVEVFALFHECFPSLPDFFLSLSSHRSKCLLYSLKKPHTFSSTCFCMRWVDRNTLAWFARPQEGARLRKKSLFSVPCLVSQGKQAVICTLGMDRGLQVCFDWPEGSRVARGPAGSHDTQPQQGCLVAPAAEWRQCWSSAGKKEDAGMKQGAHPSHKKGHRAMCFYLFEKQAVDGLLTCLSSCFPRLGISSLPGANSAFLIFPSVKCGCYWGRCKDALDRSVSWSHFSQWLQWDAQPRTMAGYTALNIAAVL